jgi:hypothetical protein
MKKLYNRLLVATLLSICSGITAGTWTPLLNAPPFGSVVAPLLLTDGSVIVQNGASGATGHIWKLVPDNTGSYINGTWTQLADLPTGYAPLFFADAVLPDGRVIYEGGEDNGGVTDAFTDLGAIYDPIANTWTSVTPPAFFVPGQLGDACSVILEDGTFMLANPLGKNAASLTWVQTGAGKFDVNDEEGWTLLPNGQVLTVDCYVNLPSTPAANRTNTELYNPATGDWSSAGNTVVTLTEPTSFEMGPQILRADGTVFVIGANGNTGFYNSSTGIWSAGPTLPVISTNQQACQDAPGALLPNGNVLFASCTLATDGTNVNGLAPTNFFESNGSTFSQQSFTADSPFVVASQFNMLVLPTGQVLMSCIDSNNVYIYTPSNTSHNAAWAPTIFCTPKKVRRSQSYQATGVLFNGMSQAGMYGDDYQAATNYPLVRITNNATGHVFYCRTHDHKNATTGLPFMGVAATNVKVSTTFDVPATVELGRSTIEVIANGIPSQPVCIYIAPATC